MERLGRAASWNLVAEESSSVRADACRDGLRGSLMDAKTLLVSYRSLARFFGCTPLAWFTSTAAISRRWCVFWTAVAAVHSSSKRVRVKAQIYLQRTRNTLTPLDVLDMATSSDSPS